MSVRAWGGRYSQRLVARTLAAKGRTCHLCELGGADSADHEPPRSVLIRAGIANPDAPRFLWPAHLGCNIDRKARPITEALRTELRDKMMARHRLPARSARFARL